MKHTEFIWAKQKMSAACRIIDCPSYDVEKNFHRDPSGFYLLIRPNFVTLQIEVAICTKDHVIEIVFRGNKSQDVYEGILRYEKKHNKSWFKDKGHVAYLGKELKKVELALVLGQNSYFQE